MHVVTPIHYTLGTPQLNHDLITMCTMNALQHAMHLGAQNIAIPSMSTGAASFPPDIVATLMIDAAAGWCSLQQTGYVEEINFCLFTQNEYQAYTRVFN